MTDFIGLCNSVGTPAAIVIAALIFSGRSNGEMAKLRLEVSELRAEIVERVARLEAAVEAIKK